MNIHKRILQGIVFCIGAAIMAYGIFGISKRFNNEDLARKSVAAHKKALNDPHSHSHEKKMAASQLAKTGDEEAFQAARQWINGSDKTLKKTAIEVLFVSGEPLDFERAMAVLEEYPLMEREVLWERLSVTPEGRKRMNALIAGDDQGVKPIEEFFIQKALFKNNYQGKTMEDWKQYFGEKSKSQDDLVSQKSLLLLIQLNQDREVHLSTLGRMLYEGRVLEELAPEVVLVVAKQAPSVLDPIYRNLGSKNYKDYFESLLYSLRLSCPKDSRIFFQQFLDNDRVPTSQKAMAVRSYVALDFSRHIDVARNWVKSLNSPQTKYELENSFKQLESEKPQCP